MDAEPAAVTRGAGRRLQSAESGRRPGEPSRAHHRGRACAEGPAHLSPHDLRHTYGHHWLVDDGDIFILIKILGHESVDVTERHYAYLLQDDLRDKADPVDLGLGLPKSKGPKGGDPWLN